MARSAPPVPTDLTASMVLLGQHLRQAGVPASPDRVQALVAALDVVGAGDPVDVYWAGRLTLCSDPQDIARFDRVWARLFGSGTEPDPGEPTTVVRMVPASPDDPGEATSDETFSMAASASRLERLRHRDVVDMTDEERHDLHRLLSAFRLPGQRRRTRRHRRAHRGTLDRTTTVRRLLAAGGEPAQLAHRRRRTRPRDVVVLADVSGSMGPYADVLLRFAHATVRGHRAHTEVFTLGTRLTRVTRELERRDPDLAMRAVGRRVPDWSGGTRLGETLKDFLDQWGQRGMARGAVVVVLSDGWERGDVTLLGDQMARLARLAHRVVWANPRAGHEGFAPLARGMAISLPSCDALVAGHSLAALERLARVVAGSLDAGVPTGGGEASTGTARWRQGASHA